MARIGFGKTILITFLLVLNGFLITSVPEPVAGLDVKGDITGNPTIWSGHVNVTGHIYINSGANLTISPGTEVEFKGVYNIYVNASASLYSNGSPGNEVLIYHQNPLSWGGILLNTTTSTAIFRYTEINHSNNGVKMDNGGSLLMDNCVVHENLFGVQGSYSDPVIRDSTFHNNTFPIFFLLNVNGTIVNSNFQNNTNSVIWQNSNGQPNFDNNLVEYTVSGSNPSGVQLSNTNIHFTNNTLRNNSGHGVSLSQGRAFIYKNVFKNNGFPSSQFAGLLVSSTNTPETSKIESNDFTSNAIGVYFERDPQPWSGANISGDFINNKIYGNTQYGVMIRNLSYPNFDNNNVFNNYRGIGVFDATPIISNSTVTGNTHTDFWLDYILSGPCVPVSLNTDFGTVNITSNATDKYLKVKWFLNIDVTENQVPFNPVPNTEVTIVSENDTGKIVFRKDTNALGKIYWLHTLEEEIWRDYTKNYTPYQITVDNKTVPRIYVKKTVNSVDVHDSVTIIIRIDRNYAPTPVMGITPLATHDSTPVFSWSASTDANSDPITYYFRLGTVPGWDDAIPEAALSGTTYAVSTPLAFGIIYYVTLKAGDNRYANSTARTVSMNITNVQPTMPGIVTSPAEGAVITDQNISVSLETPSTDDTDEVNVYGETIRYTVYVDINNIRKSVYTKLYVSAVDVDFEIDHNDFDKGDEINLTVTPFDGHGVDWESSGESGAFRHPENGTTAFITLHVENSAPRIDGSLSLGDITMDEDDVYVMPFDFETIFADPDMDIISFEYETTENIDIEYIAVSGKITIKPKPNYFSPAGESDLVILKANDSAGGITELRMNVTVNEVNDLPQVNVHTPLIAYQDKPFYINITTTDTADPHDAGNLVMTTNYNTWSFSTKYPVLKDTATNKSYYFIPRNADVGILELEVNATDGKGFNSVTIEIEVMNVNDPPAKPVVINPEVVGVEAIDVYFKNDVINFKGDLYDPDLMWGDVLEILWESNITALGPFGDQSDFNTSLLPGYHNITVTSTDLMGLTASSFFHILVIDEKTEDKARTVLKVPTKDAIWPSTTSTTQLTLVWEPMPHRYSELFRYDVYMDTDPNTKKKQVIDYNDTEYIVNVEIKQTYYWTVIPWLGEVVGECFSTIWKFEVVFDDGTKPTVKLQAPINDTKVNITKVDLSWLSTDENAANYFYRVYLDETPNPSTLVADSMTDSNVTITGLVDGKTYYWDVIPYFGSRAGLSHNGPFKFTTDFGFKAEPEITIEPQNFDYKMDSDASKEFTYTIKNTGNTVETVTITVSAIDVILSDAVVKDFTEINILLEPGEQTTVKFSVDLKKVDIGKGFYKLQMKVLSSDLDITDRYEINLDVSLPEEETGVLSGTSLMIFGLIAAVIVVVLVVLFMMFRKKPKKEEDEEGEDERVTPSGRPVMETAPSPAIPPAAQPPAAPPAPVQPKTPPTPAKPKPEMGTGTGAEPPASLPPPPGSEVPTTGAPAAAAAASAAAEPAAEAPTADQAKCPTCGSEIPAGVSECPICEAKIQ